MKLIVRAAVVVVSGACSVESEPRFGLGETCNTDLRSGPGTRTFAGGL